MKVVRRRRRPVGSEMGEGDWMGLRIRMTGQLCAREKRERERERPTSLEQCCRDGCMHAWDGLMPKGCISHATSALRRRNDCNHRLYHITALASSLCLGHAPCASICQISVQNNPFQTSPETLRARRGGGINTEASPHSQLGASPKVVWQPGLKNN